MEGKINIKKEVANPDPIVEDILLDTVVLEDEDDGFYKGWDRMKYCMRCIDHGYTDPEPGIPLLPQYAYCEKCMQELDRSSRVRALMRAMRRHSKS